jgi:multiple sugar transport system substrate-binding protein
VVRALKDRRVSDEWIDAISDSGKIARPCIPQIVSANQFRDVYGVALSNMLTGGDPARELRAATEQFKAVYAKFG